MARIAIVVGHARKESFCEALARSYEAGALSAGHETSFFVTSKLSYDPVLHEGFERVQPLEPDLQRAHDAIEMADHLVFVFPLWMGTLPAIFKGFLERVLQPDLVETAKSGIFAQPLKGKSARVVLTMGMPGFVYRWWFGAFALRMMKRNILGFVGVSPVRTSVYRSIESMGAAGRTKLLKAMEAMGREAS